MKRKISIILASLAVAFSSCSDIFELEYPASDMPEWQSISDMSTMLMDEYEQMFSGASWTYNPMANMTNHTEALSDLNQVIKVNDISTFFQYTRLDYPFDAAGASPDNIIVSIYKAIRSCNTIIEFIDSVRAGEISSIVVTALSDSELAELSRYYGESHFMRAYAYWTLCQVFMPPYSDENRDVVYVPFITSSIYSTSELLAPDMGTMGEVYDLMMSDFQTAKSELEAAGLSDSYIQQSHGGFTNKYAASAMLMRLNFVQQNWQAAIDECEYIEDSGLYTLEEQPIRAFNRDANTPDAWHYAKEVIFEARYSDTNTSADEPFALVRVTRVGLQLGQHVYTTDLSTNPNWEDGGRGVNWLHANISSIYWNNWGLEYVNWIDEGEASNTLFEPNARAYNDLRFTQTHYFLKAYEEGGDPTESEQWYTATDWNAVWNDKYWRAWSMSGSYVPIIRYPEVLLTKASCLVQLGSSNSVATAAVNEVAKRAYAPEWDSTGSFETSGLKLTSVTEDDIEKERIREFAFEMNDRLIYLSAMRRDLPSHGKTNRDTGAEVPEIAFPYNGLHCQLPDVESDYSSTAGEAL